MKEESMATWLEKNQNVHEKFGLTLLKDSLQLI